MTDGMGDKGKHVNKRWRQRERGSEARRETKTSLRHTKGEGDLNTRDMTDSHAEGTAL